MLLSIQKVLPACPKATKLQRQQSLSAMQAATKSLKATGLGEGAIRSYKVLSQILGLPPLYAREGEKKKQRRKLQKAMQTYLKRQ